MSILTVSGRALGARRPLFADWSLPLPPNWRQEGGRTLRDLIDAVVRAEVRAFEQRLADRQMFRALTAREIAGGADCGKIECGGSEVPTQPVDEGHAVATACQAFEDGLFLVVIDGKEHRELDQQIYLQPDSRVTFLRLTLLAGG